MWYLFYVSKLKAKYSLLILVFYGWKWSKSLKKKKQKKRRKKNRKQTNTFWWNTWLIGKIKRKKKYPNKTKSLQCLLVVIPCCKDSFFQHFFMMVKLFVFRRKYNLSTVFRNLQEQTLPHATSPIGQIHPFSKMVVTFERLMGFWCLLGLRKFLITMT